MNLLIGAYSIKYMTTDKKVYELKEELTNMKWDNMGLSETLRNKKTEYS